MLYREFLQRFLFIYFSRLCYCVLYLFIFCPHWCGMNYQILCWKTKLTNNISRCKQITKAYSYQWKFWQSYLQKCFLCNFLTNMLDTRAVIVCIGSQGMGWYEVCILGQFRSTAFHMKVNLEIASTGSSQGVGMGMLPKYLLRFLHLLMVVPIYRASYLIHVSTSNTKKESHT